MYFFLKEKYQTSKNLITLILSSIIMLFFGLLGELNILDKILSNTFGTVFMFLTFYLLLSKVKIGHKNFFMSICLLWLFYPTVYLFNDNILTIILFSITDLSCQNWFIIIYTFKRKIYFNRLKFVFEPNRKVLTRSKTICNNITDICGLT